MHVLGNLLGADSRLGRHRNLRRHWEKVVRLHWPRNEYRIIRKLDGDYYVQRRRATWPWWYNYGYSSGHGSLSSAQRYVIEKQAEKGGGEIIEQGKLW